MRLALLSLAAVLLVGLGGAALHAQTPAQAGNRAALVVRQGDGTLETRCVAFAEPEITGAELLTRSGLDVVLADGGGQGAAVCQIAGEGCPADACFCAFPPDYWVYWLRTERGWATSSVGASNRRLGNGAIDGWQWGSDAASALPDLSFDDVCPAQATTSTPTSTLTSTPTSTPTRTSTTMPTNTPTAMPTNTPTAMRIYLPLLQRAESLTQ